MTNYVHGWTVLFSNFDLNKIIINKTGSKRISVSFSNDLSKSYLILCAYGSDFYNFEHHKQIFVYIKYFCYNFYFILK